MAPPISPALGNLWSIDVKIVLGHGASIGGYILPLIGGVASARILAQNLIAAGYEPPPGAAAHHIVAGTAQRAADARAVLDEYGVDINAAENGVWLPASGSTPDPWGAVHSTVHTNSYYSSVNEQLAEVKSYEDVVAVLENISADLLAGEGVLGDVGEVAAGE
jgi:hypothetical protein